MCIYIYIYIYRERYVCEAVCGAAARHPADPEGPRRDRQRPRKACYFFEYLLLLYVRLFSLDMNSVLHYSSYLRILLLLLLFLLIPVCPEGPRRDRPRPRNNNSIKYYFDF